MDITQKDKQAPGFYAELFREGDLFLPVSRSLEAYLLALGCPPEKSVVHHSGIDLSRLPWRARTRGPGERTLIVTVGRMVEMKGLAYGIEAVARLVEGGLDVEYHMIGAGPLKDELVALVRRLGIEDRVHMHGGIPHDQVLSLLDRAHLMLAPSVTAANGEAEGIPNAVKEGMATGLPVVATRNSGIPELVADGVSGYLVPERDAAALAERLQWLCEHDECWEAMGRAGRARVEQEYARDALNDELVQWYERLVRRAEASDGASQNSV